MVTPLGAKVPKRRATVAVSSEYEYTAAHWRNHDGLFFSSFPFHRRNSRGGQPSKSPSARSLSQGRESNCAVKKNNDSFIRCSLKISDIVTSQLTRRFALVCCCFEIDIIIHEKAVTQFCIDIMDHIL